MNSIKDFYNEYLLATEKIIEALQQDEYEEIDSLLNLREKLLQELEAQGFHKEELFQKLDLSSIQELERLIQKNIKDKEAGISQKLCNITKSKKANSLYYNINNRGPIIFNKKI